MSGETGSKLEVERKYSVGQDFAVPDLSGLPGVAEVSSPHTYHLTAVYLDTPGFHLANAHITLRRRTGGTDAGWHLKLPAGTARREVHAPLGTGPSAVPEELAGLVANVTAGDPLRPIARLQTARTVRYLIDAAGQVLAEVADDHVTGSLPAPGGLAPEQADTAEFWQVSSAWREMEVELDSGTPDLLDAAGRSLLAAGAQLSPAASKLSLLLTTAGALPRDTQAPGGTRP